MKILATLVIALATLNTAHAEDLNRLDCAGLVRASNQATKAMAALSKEIYFEKTLEKREALTDRPFYLAKRKGAAANIAYERNCRDFTKQIVKYVAYEVLVKRACQDAVERGDEEHYMRNCL